MNRIIDFMLYAVILLILHAVTAEGYESVEYSDSWNLGTNDSIPKTEVIINPYGSNCECPE